MSRHAFINSVKFSSSKETISQANKAIVSSSFKSNVTAKEIINVICHTCVNHCVSTTHAFFCRLENKFNFANQFFLMRHQKFCHSQTNSNMTIVTASVHCVSVTRVKTFLHGAMFCTSIFFNIVAVHIKTEANSFTRFASIEHCNHTSFTACHFSNKLCICTFANSASHIFF